MKAEHYNKQLSDYTARAFAEVPEGELIDRIEAGNNADRHGVGTMRIYVHTLVLKPNEGHVTRRVYTMTATGLEVVAQECAL